MFVFVCFLSIRIIARNMRVAPHEQANLGQHSLQQGAADGSSVLVDATGALVDPDSPAGVFLSVAPMVTCMGCFLMYVKLSFAS